jgi:peptidyl-prolyl cis-trans isomerase C
MKLKLVPLVLASATLISGCLEENKAPAVSKEDAIASVNGTYISKKTLETLEKEIADRSQGQKFPKEQLVDELIQQALQKKLDQSPEVVERLATVKNSLLSQAALQDYLKANPVSDEEIKVEYDKQMGQMGEEYKARHILVKTEDEAKKIIAELEKGGNFAALAKKHSIDQAPEGDLGWFTADRMVPEFSQAVVALQNGKFTTAPVKTQFGFHVILREDSKKLTPPPLDAVKDQFRPMMQRQKAQKFVEGLRTAAKVEILLPKEAAPATPAAAPAATEATQPAAESAPAPAAQ